MLKQAVFYLLLLISSIRFVSVVYVLAKPGNNLPVLAILVTCALVIYGALLVVKRFVSQITVKQMLCFYLIQSAAVLFNIGYVALTSPLKISFAETMVVGTFLDVLLGCVLTVLMLRRLRHNGGLLVPVRNN